MPDILAAGVVVFRPGPEVLLVHRPKYDDWSFPKGKLDPGEHAVTAAVREVAEETGLRVRLGPPLPSQRYPVGRRTKTVHYWTGRVVGDDDVAGYRAGDEIDRVAWVPVAEAPLALSYEHDRETLARALDLRRRTHAVVVLRHARARSRADWEGPDPERPLLPAGEEATQRLVPLLQAYDVTRVVTSPSTRCLQTVAPYAAATGHAAELVPGLSEEAAARETVAQVVEAALDAGTGTVLCSHRPVLPLIHDAAGLDAGTVGAGQAPGEMLVLHVRKGHVAAVERHLPDPPSVD